ncbi:MAG: nuclear transport factor 2 family protein [Sphingomicrobium sp.]|nr:nuclear transport factor 2 family protein [Sphingomonadales bacterium]
MRTLIAVIVVAASLVACAKTPGGHPPLTEAEALKAAGNAEASFTTGDVNAVMRNYDDHAVMIDASAPRPSDDRKVTTGWARYFVSMKPADYTVVGRHIQLLGPDAFVSSGIERFTVAAGAARPVVSARFTDVFQREPDGTWKIVHEHVSAPPTSAGVE